MRNLLGWRLGWCTVFALWGACHDAEHSPSDMHGPHDGGSSKDFEPNVLPVDGGNGIGHLWFTVTDHDAQLPLPARVVFRPPPGAGFADSITSGTYDPSSPGGATGAAVGPGVVGTDEGVLLQSGQGVVPVPPGKYKLFFTAGPEYESYETTVTVADGESRMVLADLDHSVDTGGWLSADLHVHTERSFDSKLLLERRVISMVTSGVDLIVTSDHNVLTDLSPVITSLGYGPETVGALVGNEFNFGYGHGGAYPVPYDAMKPFGGADDWQDCSKGAPVVGPTCMIGADAFAFMHAKSALTVVTINHPYWDGGDLGYFTNIPWGAGTSNPIPAPLVSEGSFDAIELLNGYQLAPTPVQSLLADWFFLLSHGTRVTALGSSDTHRINWVRAGYPRTWFRMPTDTPGAVTGEMLSDAIRNQRAIASTGPFLVMTIDGKQIGDTLVPSGGKVSIDITADAPNWMKLEQVQLYVNGALTRTFMVDIGQRPAFHMTFDEPVSTDSFIVAIANGAQPLPADVVGEYSNALGYDALPWAVTNPIFVDYNNDGHVTPPPIHGMPQPFPPPARASRDPDRGPDACKLNDFGPNGPDSNRPRSKKCDIDRPTLHEPSLDALRNPERYIMPLLYQ